MNELKEVFNDDGLLNCYLEGTSLEQFRMDIRNLSSTFFDWHKEKGYVSIKRDDFEEYINEVMTIK